MTKTIDYIARDALVEEIDWSEGGRIHNWRNHVGEHTRAIWHTLTPEQKVAIARDAEGDASAEEWE